jgi:hypothetical protein
MAVSRMNLRMSPLRASPMTAGLLSGLFCLTGSAFAASPVPLSAEILGQVRNSGGVAQMGAAVSLYNRYDELVRKGLTNEQGRFVFDSLVPDLYSIRVVLASFVPAERRNISVLPNTENRLEISLASVLSTVELAPPSAPGTLMTDDWKWVLRSSQSTRPVLRLLPDRGPSSSSSRSLMAAFSNTTGVVKLSAGDGESFSNGGQQDLGTAFALATSLAGSGRVQFSGNVGYRANAGLPAAGFRTSYSRPSADGSSPEVVVTMRQLSVGPRGGSGIAVGTDSAPALRTMSVAFLDGLQIADNLRLDYGFDSQSISYLDRLNYVSPFLRVSYDAGPQGRVRLAYSSGAHPTELLARDADSSGNLDQDLGTLALIPRVSLSDGHVAVEHTQNFEIGYERVDGSRTYSLGAYQENVSNAAFMLSSAPDFLPAGDLLPDLERLGVELIEQPFPAGRLDQLRWLQERSPLPIVADESCVLPEDLDRLVGVVAGVNVKLAKCGGIGLAKRMLERARELGFRTFLGCMEETSVGIAGSAVVASLAEWVDLDGCLLLADDPFEGLELDADHRWILSSRPGLGMTRRHV